MNDTLNQYVFNLKRWDGGEESVTYSLPPLREIPDYMDLSGDESRLLEYLTDKPEGFADKFTDESIFAALDQVGEQMDPRVAAWVDRQAAKIRKLRAEKAKLGLLPNPGTDSPQTSPAASDGTSKESPNSQSLK